MTLESQRTIFNIKINVDLLQSHPHAWTLDIGKHDKLDVRRGLVVMELVLTGSIADETDGEKRWVISIGGKIPLRYNKTALVTLPIIVTSEFTSHIP